MSLITRCPACTTMFKVVPDQLRVSDGWVRCGQCDEVFDANAYLQPGADGEPDSLQADNSSQLDWGGTLEEEVAPPASEIQLEFPGEAASIARPSVPNSADNAPSHFASDAMVDGEAAAKRDDAEVASQLQAAIAPAKQKAASDSVAAPDFLRKAKTSSSRGTRVKRILAASLCFLLVCLLGVQILVQERDRLAATDAATLAFLEPLCAAAGCSIGPLRQIESVVIDHSAFSKVHPSVYKFSFAVKSTALVAVAVPSLELTLTDLQDRPVVRRVFSPAELGAQMQALAPGGEWSRSVPIEIRMSEAAVDIAGYRLLAFYP